MSKEYKIHNDGYGYLSAEFPEAYPITHVESDTTDTMLRQKIEAILKTVRQVFAVGEQFIRLTDRKTGLGCVLFG